MRPRIVQKYVTSNGSCPFDSWFRKLKDKKTKAVIDARLIKVRLGHFGNARSVGMGVYEFKIHYGPGYRIYFTEIDHEIILLLCAGDKSSQQRDIKRAQRYWAEYKESQS